VLFSWFESLFSKWLKLRRRLVLPGVRAAALAAIAILVSQSRFGAWSSVNRL
jgi:hypothetical protein